MKKAAWTILLAVLATDFSCRKSPDFDQLSSNFVVATNVDSTANFSNYQTYYISDTIAYISSSSDDTILFDNNAEQLVSAVKQNMEARGFSFVGKNSNPDLGINMGAVKDVDAGVVYPGWWWDYPGWWDPWYWGGYYPYYYPWSVAYVITSGTIVVDMIDLKNAMAKQQNRVLWSSVMGGALGTDATSNLQRGIDAINQSFLQSPAVTTK